MHIFFQTDSEVIALLEKHILEKAMIFGKRESEFNCKLDKQEKIFRKNYFDTMKLKLEKTNLVPKQGKPIESTWCSYFGL